MEIFEHKIERSSSSHAILEKNSRTKKAKKIVAVISEKANIKNLTVLDIGTGSGQIPYEISKFAKKVCSVDIVDERKNKKNYEFKIAKDEKIPYGDNSFDIVVSNHVIEHTPDQKKHLEEIMRVVKQGGYVYIATPNKWWLTDPHYKLPFISWLPRSVSHKYLKIVQGKEWDIYPISFTRLSKQLKAESNCIVEVNNALVFLIKGKASESLDQWKIVRSFGKILPKKILDLSKFISPTIILLVNKK